MGRASPPTLLPSGWLATRRPTPYPPTLNALLLPYPTPRVSRTLVPGAFFALFYTWIFKLVVYLHKSRFSEKRVSVERSYVRAAGACRLYPCHNVRILPRVYLPIWVVMGAPLTFRAAVRTPPPGRRHP